MDRMEFIGNMKNAIIEDDLEQVIDLLKNNSEFLNLSMPIGSWLNFAVRHKKMRIVKELINEGIDKEIVIASNKGNALIDAARNDDIQMIEYLIGEGISLNCSLTDSNPLFSAIDNNRIGTVKYLLKLEKKYLKEDNWKQLCKLAVERSQMMSYEEMELEIVGICSEK